MFRSDHDIATGEQDVKKSRRRRRRRKPRDKSVADPQLGPALREFLISKGISPEVADNYLSSGGDLSALFNQKSRLETKIDDVKNVSDGSSSTIDADSDDDDDDCDEANELGDVDDVKSSATYKQGPPYLDSFDWYGNPEEVYNFLSSNPFKPDSEISAEDDKEDTVEDSDASNALETKDNLEDDDDADEDLAPVAEAKSHMAPLQKPVPSELGPVVDFDKINGSEKKKRAVATDDNDGDDDEAADFELLAANQELLDENLFSNNPIAAAVAGGRII